MQWALVNGERQTAVPHMRGQCPTCQTETLSKCGKIMPWHWAHRTAECDSWSEPESWWHRNWKERFPRECQEVVVGNHRADVKTATMVVEFQSSSISPENIRAREDHYGNMAWVINAAPFQERVTLEDRGEYVSFRWAYARESWRFAKCSLFLDFDAGWIRNHWHYGDGPKPLLLVKNLPHSSHTADGRGLWVWDADFVSYAINGGTLPVAHGEGVCRHCQGLTSWVSTPRELPGGWFHRGIVGGPMEPCTIPRLSTKNAAISQVTNIVGDPERAREARRLFKANQTRRAA